MILRLYETFSENYSRAHSKEQTHLELETLISHVNMTIPLHSNDK